MQAKINPISLQRRQRVSTAKNVVFSNRILAGRKLLPNRTSVHPPRLYPTSNPTMDFPEPNSHSAPPPSYASSSIPAAGLRVPTVTTSAFPSVDLIGKPPFTDLGGEPVWVGSALMGNSVHPAKVAPHLPGVCRVPFGG